MIIYFLSIIFPARFLIWFVPMYSKEGADKKTLYRGCGTCSNRRSSTNGFKLFLVLFLVTHEIFEYYRKDCVVNLVLPRLPEKRMVD